MKILLATMQYGRSYSQGTERYVATLSDCLRRRGHEVSILAGDPLHVGPRLRPGQAVPQEPDVLAYPTRGWMAVEGLPARRLAAWLRGHGPDVVHLNTPAHIGAGILAACRRVGIPSVVTVHDFWWICPKGTLLTPGGRVCDGSPGWAGCVRCLAGENARGWLRRLAAARGSAPLLLGLFFARSVARGMGPADMLRWPRRRAFLCRELAAADFVIFPSRAIADVMGPALPGARWRVVPNGLGKAWFDNPTEPSRAAKTPSELCLGYAGALAPHKGPHLLLEAVRQLGWRDARVRIAGSGTNRAYGERLRQAAGGLNVEFAGRIPPERMPAFLRTLDVLAMTSVWPENCPYAVLEAQAAGVPVVGSRLGGVIERIADERLLFEAGSAESLATALDYARRHPEAGRSARVPTADEMTDAVEAVYGQVVPRRGGSR